MIMLLFTLTLTMYQASYTNNTVPIVLYDVRVQVKPNICLVSSFPIA